MPFWQHTDAPYRICSSHKLSYGSQSHMAFYIEMFLAVFGIWKSW